MTTSTHPADTSTDGARIDTTRDAMQQALEALTVLLDEWTPAWQAQQKGIAAIAALRAALAEQAQPVGTDHYRKRPVVIEAIQWDGTETGIQKIKAKFAALDTLAKTGYLKRDEVTRWRIGTLEGGHEVSKGDFIIKGVKGEFYPCKPDIFAMTYEPAASEAPSLVVPQPQPLTDEDIARIVRDASAGSSTRRDGTTSTRIARAVEAEVIRRMGVQR